MKTPNPPPRFFGHSPPRICEFVPAPFVSICVVTHDGPNLVIFSGIPDPPQVSAILLTPICPHSLSFRPVIFPDDVQLTIRVPRDARASAWVSFDGRNRMEFHRCESITVRRGRFPVPTIALGNDTRDWLQSLSQCLRWNERITQEPLKHIDSIASEFETLDLRNSYPAPPPSATSSLPTKLQTP
mmetsp:Transcript_2714/g.4917  ORF Transcript_2714/g.4917 Transcript_2714/m.4917 type:complete len:185 (-) Transcript_2714:45-599(-)